MVPIQPFQLAIANAVLEHLITQVRCKTLFITHYPQIGKELEAKAKCPFLPIVLSLLVLQYPTEVSNAHMGFIEEEKMGEPLCLSNGVPPLTYCFSKDGHREVHFLYTLTRGITHNSFGIECARLAGLPERSLQVAVQRSIYSTEMEQSRLKTRRYYELFPSWVW